jgi:hypothetical protein
VIEMAEARSNTQLPLGSIPPKSIVDEELEAFQHGIELGRQYAEVAVRRVAAWAEENPGRFVLAGLAAGFVFGKLVFRQRRPRRPMIDPDLDL